jgi:hypothetical protein
VRERLAPPVTWCSLSDIVLADLGLDLMREVAYFKETVFTLRGDISYILHRERGSRNGRCQRSLNRLPPCL